MSTTIETKVGVNSATVTFGELNQPFSVTIGTFDNVCRDFHILSQCEVKVAETLQKKFVSTKKESAKVSETKHWHYASRYNCNLLMAETGYKKVVKKNFNGLSFNDMLSKTAKFRKSYSENWKVDEVEKNNPHLYNADEFAVTDKVHDKTFGGMTLPFNSYTDEPFFRWAFYAKFKKNHLDAFRLNENYSRNIKYQRTYICNCHIDEIVKNCSSISKNTAFVVTDRDLDETFKNMTLPFSSYAGVPFYRETFWFKVKKNNLGILKLNDICNKKSKHRFDDGYKVTDLLNTSTLFYRDYETSFALSDFNWFGYNLNESIGVMFSEYNKLHISVNNYTQFGLTDDASTVAVFNRLFDYALNTQEVVAKSIKCLEQETSSIRDAYVQNVNGTLSNIEIAEGESTLEQFLENAERIAGYTKFFDFKVGEYEYKDASVRVVLKAIDQVQPSAQGVTMHVDIPDTDDRGVAQITDTSGPTKVHFNKSYYNPPEVQVTLRNATTASGTVIPNIVSTSGEDEYGRYFEVELIGSSGSLTTGTISWVAKGY